MEEQVQYVTSRQRNRVLPVEARAMHEDPTFNDTYARMFSWLWDEAIDISAPARALYWYIVHRIGAAEDKQWGIARKDMAKALKLSERSLTKYVCELEDAGLIMVIDRKAESKPSIYRVLSRTTVEGKITLTQNLRQGSPNAKSAAPSRKDCATLPRDLRRNKVIDTDIDTDIDTEGTGADAPRADKPRTPSLKQTEPHIWTAREAIKDRYLTLNDLNRSDLTPTRLKYVNADAEALARKCAERGDALAAVQATWDEQWSNGTYPNRDHRLLKKALEKLAAFRRGELGHRPNGRRGPLRMNQGTSAEVERSWSDRIPECGACGWDEGYNPACPTCRAFAAAQERDL